MTRHKDRFPVPALCDIADSAHWANKPDVGIIIHRYDVRAPNTLLRIAKVRYRAVGRPGDLAGVWNDDTSRYTMGDITEILGEDYT
jgi:twinkle protein